MAPAPPAKAGVPKASSAAGVIPPPWILPAMDPSRQGPLHLVLWSLMAPPTGSWKTTKVPSVNLAFVGTLAGPSAPMAPPLTTVPTPTLALLAACAMRPSASRDLPLKRLTTWRPRNPMPWTLLAHGALASLPIAAASTIPCVLPLLAFPVGCLLLLLTLMMICPLVLVGLALLVMIRPREGTPNLVLGVGLIIPQAQKAQPNALAPTPAHPQATREAIREPPTRLQNRMESPLQNRLQTQSSSPLQSWRLLWGGPLFLSPQLPPFGWQTQVLPVTWATVTRACLRSMNLRPPFELAMVTSSILPRWERSGSLC